MPLYYICRYCLIHSLQRPVLPVHLHFIVTHADMGMPVCVSFKLHSTASTNLHFCAIPVWHARLGPSCHASELQNKSNPCPFEKSPCWLLYHCAAWSPLSLSSAWDSRCKGETSQYSFLQTVAGLVLLDMTLNFSIEVKAPQFNIPLWVSVFIFTLYHWKCFSHPVIKWVRCCPKSTCCHLSTKTSTDSQLAGPCVLCEPGHLLAMFSGIWKLNGLSRLSLLGSAA